MDWINKLNSVIDYIEENLKGQISYEKIGEIACCSVYNFQRMFSYIADKPLAEYIRSRRLTLAAFDVLNTRDRILDIALTYGYESQDSFTRAFKAFHGVLPSIVRNEVAQLKSCPKLSFQITIKGENYMNYQVEAWPSFKLSGFRKSVITEKAFEIVPGIWANAWKDGTMERFFSLLQKTDYRPSGILGLAIGGNHGESEEMDYFMGVVNHVDTQGCAYVSPPEDMEEIELKAATWVIFNADGELPEAVQNVYKEFYSQWLPHSGYGLEDLPVLECYMQGNRQEVWIAVKKD